MTVLHGGIAFQGIKGLAGEQFFIDFYAICGLCALIVHSQRLVFHHIDRIEAGDGEALCDVLGAVVAIGNGHGQTGGVKCITLFKLRFVRATVFHLDALHLFQRHGLGAVLVGSHGAGGGLIALVVTDGGIGVRDAFQQLIAAVTLRLDLRVAPLDGQGRTRGRDIEGHVHPSRGVLRQRNSNIGRISHGVVLIGHGHAAGLLRVAGAGHGVGIRCIGGGQRHGGGAGISAAVYRKHSILGLNGKRHRRGGGLPAEGGIVAGLGHEGAA